ncbi:uncharacterized protein LOC113214353 isoform X5 [Frankliniella occidentalis]|uniref:Uncharacterized protein LOC113214353 isoform X5 n=1 Tax=Frankliniella occidentalis TaxID=133901 RepID=A0A9C6U701_FRAOC|nr:uncharacterized protein LOC113214353 isoform X5 [Frankliniella occidentalis]
MGTQPIKFTDFGLPPIGGCPLNACLQVLFHSPSFISYMVSSDHKLKCIASDNCVLCLVLKIWEHVNRNMYCGNLNSELCKLLGCTAESDVFYVMSSIVSEMHYAFQRIEPSYELSPIFDSFGGIIEIQNLCQCHGIQEPTGELSIGAKVFINANENLQQAIDELYSSKNVLCETCGSEKQILKKVLQLPDIFLISPIRPELEHYVVPSTVNLGPGKKYEVIGSIINGTTANVKTYSGTFVQLQDKRKRGVSWHKVQNVDAQNSCQVLVYQSVCEGPLKFREVRTPKKMKCSTPIGSARSTTTAWNVTPIVQPAPPVTSGRRLQPKRLDYGVPLAPHQSSSASEKMSPAKSNCGASPRTPSQRSRKIKYVRLRSVVSYEFCCKDPKKFKHFTGLSIYNFKVLYNLLGGDQEIRRLKVKGYAGRTPKRFSVEGKLSSKDKLLMFLWRLRRGMPLRDLAYIFGVGLTTCCQVVYAMLRYLCLTFQGLEKDMFISAQDQKKKPKPFKPFPNLRAIIDGFEIFIQTPSNFQQQGNTYSDYKAHNTIRFLVGISCHGGILFVSPGYEGSMSEKQALKESGFMDFLEPGDVIMSDRGFAINNDLLRIGVDVLKPPSLDGRPKFTPEEEILTRAIASARIYVEHAVRLIKVNRLLQGIIPLKLLPTISDYVYVAGYLANFGYKTFQGSKNRNKKC